MKEDVVNWAQGKRGSKRISKETLNHRRLIERVSGLDVFTNSKEAYLRAYQALGIDLINRVPLENAPVPVPGRMTRRHPDYPDYKLSSLGVYDTVARMCGACDEVDDVFGFDMEGLAYTDLITPVPHPCDADDIRRREAAIGEIGQYYPMLYTTLFMWPIETFGWEIFMTAALEDSERFFDHVLKPCIKKSKALVAEMVRGSSSQVIFVHDDLCDVRGPVFPPGWYDEFIFPHYADILAPARAAGRKVVLVADGNLTALLPQILESGFDGLMFENPATPLDEILSVFDLPDHLLIGGIETVKLTMDTPGAIREMVLDVNEKISGLPGFAFASCGGLHGNIPLENLEAYFDARAEVGATPRDWRTICRK
jgi:hypothetical protein